MMLMKPSLLKLDPDTRAFTLVGGFMGFFALLEAGINEAIGEVLQMDGVRRVILGRNMSFDEKIKTLRTLIDFYVTDKSDRLTFDMLAIRARKYSEERNVVAHTPFRRSAETDGVEFFVVSASRKLEYPHLHWSIDDFLERIDGINQLDNDLRSIERKMSLQRLGEAIADDKGTPALTRAKLSEVLFSLDAGMRAAEERSDV